MPKVQEDPVLSKVVYLVVIVSAVVWVLTLVGYVPHLNPLTR